MKEFTTKKWVTATPRGGLRITAAGVKELDQDDKDRGPQDLNKPL